ncbi:succinylglutamate desuccinylase [Klebsiella oxytoca]|jgi:succinylglutamate desuccinylase|nr:succinylglutamate desuccinylase [Klebsiella oxytoca]KMD71147.1 succinylglutamate desuccinylase [Klebsiella pneumoniae]KMG63714.1 succinylglutamate desuccinylase [Klebsiella pneumoniae]CAF2266180.1 Succinylglutamate desuccinylase [Klebsiella pneumoniae]CAH5253533.1 Succinylglutamate desuccinylase [Klebsiella pneumoniae]
MMNNFLDLTLRGMVPDVRSEGGKDLSWHWRGEGILELVPHTGYQRAIVLSAGIHGNETAPVELLAAIVDDLLAGRLPLAARLLVLYGNPPAIRAGQRYLTHDLNRLFSSRHHQYPGGEESARAQELEQTVTDFFTRDSDSDNIERWHFDLHTTRHASHLPRFGLLPFQTRHGSAALLRALDAAGLDALVQHTEPGATFSHFTSEQLRADSCTLELGGARRFGENDLSSFGAVDSMLRALIGDAPLPVRAGNPMRYFRVNRSLIKHSELLCFHLDADVPNFTPLTAGTLIGELPGECWRVEHGTEWILFPNPNVTVGLRAGLLLAEETGT